MKRIITTTAGGFWLAGALLLALAVGGASPAYSEPTSTDLVIMHPVRLAFYERAPRSLGESMRKGVRQGCADVKGVETWLCDGRHLNFLRGVDVRGHRLLSGLVCDDESISPDLKYFLDDMLTDEVHCRIVSFNGEEHRHYL